MEGNKREDEQYKRRAIAWLHTSIIRSDAPVLLFLLIGWLLIFATATLGLQRVTAQWVPVNLAAQISADYSVDKNILKAAPINVENISRDIKQDEQLALAARPPAIPLPEDSLLATVTPTLTPTRSPGLLTVSAGGPYDGEEGSDIVLAADGYGTTLTVVPDNLIYFWDLDNDGFYDDSTGITTTVTYNDEGAYTVGVQVSDPIDREATDTALVNVSNAPPIITVGENLFSNEGEEVEFLVEVTDPGDDILFYHWNFGDGDLLNDTAQPRHIYDDNGEYLVTLTVRDNDNGQSRAELMVFVGNLPPEVDAGPDQVTDEGSSITLSGQATDPAGSEDILFYAWDFDYSEGGFTPDAEGHTVSTTYPDGPAKIAAALLVFDEDGGETLDTVNITVNNVPPVIHGVTNTGPVGEGSAVIVDVDATDVGSDTLTYVFDWDDDGSYDTEQQASSGKHTYFNEGSYPIAVLVDDGDDGQDTISTTVSVTNLPPIVVAEIKTLTTPIKEGDTITFDGSKTTDPGINDVLTYAWNFDDNETAAGSVVSHVYKDNNVYSTTLTVTDDAVPPGIGRDAIAVNVVNANPTAEIVKVTTTNNTVIVKPATKTEIVIEEGVDLEFDFEGQAIDPGTDDTLTFAWDFDYPNDSFDVEKTGTTTDWFYPELDGPGERRVALRVRDDDYPFPTAGGGEVGQALATFKITIINVPPQNVSAGGPYLGLIDQPVTLTGSADDIPGDPLEYRWDLNNDDTTDKISRVISHTWSASGEYIVKLKVFDGDITTDWVTTRVTINAPPRAEAGGPYTGLEGAAIPFDGSGTTDPDQNPLTLGYSWNFGDGTTGTGPNPTHAYADNGVYNVSLTVNDGRGGVSTDTATVTVLNANPNASINQPTAGPNFSINEGLNLTITFGSNSTDPGSADTLTYAWDIDNDGVYTDASGPLVNWTFPMLDGPDTFIVGLRVRDDDYPFTGGGEIGQDITTVQITVNNLAPQNVSAGGPYQGVENQPVTLSGTATDFPGDPLQYGWDVDGDDIIDLSGQNVTHTWNAFGTYTVKLFVSDGDATVTATAQVRINAVPIADAGGPYTGLEGGAILFDGSGTVDPNGDPLTYAWDFGDGGAAAGVSPSHTYTDNGVYPVLLTVTDPLGQFDTDTVNVTILNASPTANAGADTVANEGQSITLNGSATDPGSDTLVYDWDFDYDGVTFDVDAANNASPSVTYQDGPATFTVALRVRDDDLGEDIDTLTVMVNNLTPIVNANPGPPYRGNQGDVITLTGAASDAPLDSLSLVYDWDLDDDSLYETPGQIVTNTWSTGGVYTVALRVTDKDGASGFATAQVDINSIPVANAGGPYSGNEGAPIAFSGNGSDADSADVLTLTWDFGDGSPPVNGANPSHTYNDNGTYNVTLTIDDGQGGVATDTTMANVANLPPIANAGGPYSGNENAAINFNGSGADPGPGDIPTLSYLWAFGDGNTANTANPSHIYADDGTYFASLTVSDDDGGSDVTTVTIPVANLNPTANAGGPYRTTVNVPTTLNGSGSDVPADLPDLIFEWDSDYGGTFNVDGAGPTPTFSWLTPGVRTIALRVSDGDGGLVLVTTTVDVGSPPTAVIAVSANPAVEGDLLTFDGLSSGDPDGDPLMYVWNFGDGGMATTPVAAHRYIDDGSYIVTLSVDDGRGGVAVDTLSVTINNANPNANPGGPYNGNEGTPINFNGSATDPGAADVPTLTYLWDFGDGNTANIANPTHPYADDGAYTATLTVTDDEGGIGITPVLVTIQNVAPTANAGPDLTVTQGQPVNLVGTATDPGADTLTYRWDLDYTGTFIADAVGQSVTTSWTTAGTFTAALQVEDDEGAATIDTLTVQVNSLVPIAGLGSLVLLLRLGQRLRRRKKSLHDMEPDESP